MSFVSPRATILALATLLPLTSSHLVLAQTPGTGAEIDPIVEEYREHMKLIHALKLLPPSSALLLLTREAFRYAEDPSHVTAPLAGFGLRDRVAEDPSPVIAALSSSSREMADRAEWILVKADPAILPALRAAITSASPAVRIRLVQILAWQGDQSSIPVLRALKTTDPANSHLIDWALNIIAQLHLPQKDVVPNVH
jgi:HEAT repeats